MKPLPVILGLLAVIGILSFLQWKGCQARKVAVAQIQQANTQAQQASMARDSAVKHDSATNIAYGMELARWAADSTRMSQEYQASNNDVEREKEVLKGKVEAFRQAQADRDTVRQLITCDSALTELRRAKVAVVDLQSTGEAALTAYGQEIGRRDSTIAAQRGAFQLLNRAFDSLADANRKQTDAAAKLAKQAGKRFSVGPGIGLTIVGGNAQPVFGIDVHYSLFRF